MANERVIGQVHFGTKVALEVIDVGDDQWIEIRYPDSPKDRLRVPKQAAHVLASVLQDVDVKYPNR